MQIGGQVSGRLEHTKVQVISRSLYTMTWPPGSGEDDQNAKYGGHGDGRDRRRSNHVAGAQPCPTATLCDRVGRGRV